MSAPSRISGRRAIESEKPEGVRICYDPYTVKLFDPLLYRFMRIFIDTGYAERAGPGAGKFLVSRCRYMDDALQNCLADKLEQLGLPGRKLWYHFYHFELLRYGVKVFEVDHPPRSR